MMGCWLYRWQVEQALDANQPLAAPAQRHVNGCRECRRHWETHRDLRSRLISEAQSNRMASSTRLQGRILAEIRNRRPERDSRRLRPLQVVFGGVAAVAVVVLLSVGFVSGKWFSERSEMSGRSLADIPPKAITLAGLDREPLSMVWTEPLEGELRALARDARTALDLLAHDFAPGR
jgi:hypothetical protein